MPSSRRSFASAFLSRTEREPLRLAAIVRKTFPGKVRRTADPSTARRDRSASLPRLAGAGGMTKERVVERERTAVKGQGSCWHGWEAFPSTTARSFGNTRSCAKRSHALGMTKEGAYVPWKVAAEPIEESIPSAQQPPCPLTAVSPFQQPSPLSSREPVTFSIFSCFLHIQPAVSSPPTKPSS